jgi:hypothetical protein
LLHDKDIVLGDEANKDDENYEAKQGIGVVKGNNLLCVANNATVDKNENDGKSQPKHQRHHSKGCTKAIQNITYHILLSLYTSFNIHLHGMLSTVHFMLQCLVFSHN